MTQVEGMRDRIAALEAERDRLERELAGRAEILLAYEEEIDDLGRALAALSDAHREAVAARRALETEMALGQNAADMGETAPPRGRLSRILARLRRS